jgi:hypothetical protein
MFRSNAQLSGLGAVAIGCLLGGGCSPCHTGHTEVTFEAAHSSYEYDFLNERWEWNDYPDQCHSHYICDIYCEALDKGRSEAHTKHETLRLAQDMVDARCEWNGVTAWPKR